MAEIARQGVWASLTGGWHYEPSHSIFCNTVHLYVWLLLLLLPLLLGLSGATTTWIAIYTSVVALLFIVLKSLVLYLHSVFDTHEPILVTASDDTEQVKSEDEADEEDEEAPDTEGFEMTSVREVVSHSCDDHSELDVNPVGGGDERSAGGKRVRIHRGEPVVVVAENCAKDSSSDSDARVAGAPGQRTADREVASASMSKRDSGAASDHLVTADEDSDEGAVMMMSRRDRAAPRRKMSDPIVVIDERELSEMDRGGGGGGKSAHARRLSDADGQRVRRANSSFDPRREKSRSGGTLSLTTLEQCRQVTRKSYPSRMSSSTDEFLHGNSLMRRGRLRARSSESAIRGRGGGTTGNRTALIEEAEAEDAEARESLSRVDSRSSRRSGRRSGAGTSGGRPGTPVPEAVKHFDYDPLGVLRAQQKMDGEEGEGEEEGREKRDEEKMDSVSEMSSSHPSQSTSGWTPVVVSLGELDRPSTSTSALHRASERIAGEDLPGPSESSSSHVSARVITKFLEELIDRHPETLVAIESVRRSRGMGGEERRRSGDRVERRDSRESSARQSIGGGQIGGGGGGGEEQYVMRRRHRRRASPAAVSTSSTAAIHSLHSLSDLATRDGTHVASGHEDTSQGAVHSFQDEHGNWWTYAFDEQGVGTAHALGSGRALMELLHSGGGGHKERGAALQALPESAYSSDDDDRPGTSRAAAAREARRRGGGGGGGGVWRERVASVSSGESQTYLPPMPASVLHAPGRGSLTALSQPVSLQSVAGRIRAAGAAIRAGASHDEMSWLTDLSELEVMPPGGGGGGGGGRRGIAYLHERLIAAGRQDSVSSQGTARLRLLSELRGTLPGQLPLAAGEAFARKTSAKKHYYYRLSLKHSDRTFKLNLDRLSLAALFDRNRSAISCGVDVLLAVAVCVLSAMVLRLPIYHDISVAMFAFVVAGGHFSLLKSVQPDAASPIHGFNWLVAYSRPVYLCAACAGLIGLHESAAALDPHVTIAWNWNVYRWSSTPWPAVLLAARDALATATLLFPIAFTVGWMPQVSTVCMHVLEQCEMHVFGGTAAFSLPSAAAQLARSGASYLLLVSAAHAARWISPQSTQSAAFSAFCGLTIAVSYLLSRFSSNLALWWLWLRDVSCWFTSGRGWFAERGDEEEEDSDADPLPSLLRSTLRLRSRHDSLWTGVIVLVVFALHSTSLFTATQPFLTTVLSCVTIVVGVLNHYLFQQLRTHTPWKLLRRPVLRPAEWGQFETTVAARLMNYECVHVWALAVERNVLYPLLAVSLLTEAGWSTPAACWTLPLMAIRVVRGGYSHPQLVYLPLAFSLLLSRFDWAVAAPGNVNEKLTSPCLFLFVFFASTLIYPKWLELQLKIHFVLAYVAPWQISWGSAFHAFAQPFAVPHAALLAVHATLASLVSAPLNPFLGSSFFTASYVRPVKFWEKDYNTKRSDASNTRLANLIDRGPMVDDSNLNAVFYEHLTRSLQQSLAGDLLMGRWASSVQPGDCFILASFYLNSLVHIIEVGNGFVSFQLRGLEFRGTYCHQREVEAISEDTTDGAGCCCCSPGSLPGLLSLNTAFSLRWSAWEVTAAKYVIDGYSITDNSAVNLLQVHELRRLLVSLYVKCIIYYASRSDKLVNWLHNPAVISALEPIRGSARYVDVDLMFCAANDEDYDATQHGISRSSFNQLYAEWQAHCVERRMEERAPDGREQEEELLCTWFEPLCYALSLIGRRALAAAAFNRHSNAAESFLYGLHALFKGDFRVTCARDEWVFADMELLRCAIAPAVRMALKLHQDHFAASDDFDAPSSLYDLIKEHESNLFISHEHDPGWRRAIIRNTPSLLALRHMCEDGQDDYKIIMLNRMHLNMRVIKLNRECVRAFWAGQQQELIFLRNRNPERGSIQNARQVLRNMINSSADQPIGYPIYVSPLTTSFVESHPQVESVLGRPVTAQCISSWACSVWETVRSHFGPSRSSVSQPTAANKQSTTGGGGGGGGGGGMTAAAAPVGGEHKRSGSGDSGGERASNNSGSQATGSSGRGEASIVHLAGDGTARVSLCRMPRSPQRPSSALSGPSPSGTPSGKRKLLPPQTADTKYAVLVDVEQVFKCLNEPLKTTGEPLVEWPSEEWREAGGKSGWQWVPTEGWIGQVVHVWYPNHAQRAHRSHIGDAIYLTAFCCQADLSDVLVPIGEKGVRVMGAKEARKLIPMNRERDRMDRERVERERDEKESTDSQKERDSVLGDEGAEKKE